MARNQTTWPKGQKPPVKKPKGAKSKKTLLKESLGLKGWNQLASFIENEGAEKYVVEMMKLSGRNFTTALAQFTEYVKPKLTRTDLELGPKITEVLVTIGGKNLPPEGQSILNSKTPDGSSPKASR